MTSLRRYEDVVALVLGYGRSGRAVARALRAGGARLCVHDDNPRARALARADGVIIVSPEYNWSVPPALSNLIDHFQTEFRKKPFGFITYSVGPFGGRAAAAALPTLVVGVGGVAVPAAMQIPAAQNQMDAAGKPLNDQLERFGDEFIAKYEWYLRVFSAANRAEA